MLRRFRTLDVLLRSPSPTGITGTPHLCTYLQQETKLRVICLHSVSTICTHHITLSNVSTQIQRAFFGPGLKRTGNENLDRKNSCWNHPESMESQLIADHWQVTLSNTDSKLFKLFRYTFCQMCIFNKMHRTWCALFSVISAHDCCSLPTDVTAYRLQAYFTVKQSRLSHYQTIYLAAKVCFGNVTNEVVHCRRKPNVSCLPNCQTISAQRNVWLECWTTHKCNTIIQDVLKVKELFVFFLASLLWKEISPLLFRSLSGYRDPAYQFAGTGSHIPDQAVCWFRWVQKVMIVVCLKFTSAFTYWISFDKWPPPAVKSLPKRLRKGTWVRFPRCVLRFIRRRPIQALWFHCQK